MFGQDVYAEVRPSTSAGAAGVIVEGAPEDGPSAVLFDAHGLPKDFLGLVQDVVQIAPPF
jgi:hypothetical protein